MELDDRLQKCSALLPQDGNDVSGIEVSQLQSSVRELLRFLQTSLQIKKLVRPTLEQFVEVLRLVEHRNCPSSIALLLGKAYCLMILSLNQDLMEEFNRLGEKTGIVKIAVLYGLLSSTQFLDEEKTNILINRAYDEIVTLLDTFCRFYTCKLRVVHSWLEICRPQKTKLPLFTNRLLKLLDYTNLHWETSLPGCGDTVRSVVDLVCQILEQNDPEAITDYVENVVQSWSWNAKAKYLILSIMLPRSGYSRVFDNHCDLMFLLSESLKSSSLSSAGSELYKSIIKTLNFAEWKNICRDMVFETVKHSNKTVQTNCVNLWLPITLQIHPQIFAEFRTGFSSNGEIHWLPLVSLLKVAKLLGVADDDEEDLPIILQALQHGDEEVRIAAFSYVSFSRKKSDPVSRGTWTQILNFVKKNLHVDSAQFRQNLQARLKLVVLQILENSLTLCKDKTNPQLLENLNYCEELHQVLMEGLRPGSSYQRRIASLSGLELMLKIFYGNEADLAELAKGSTVTRRSELMKIAAESGKLQFTRNVYIQRYLLCLMDEISEVGEKSYNILARFFNAEHSTSLQLFTVAREHCDSAKFQHSECGARLFRLLHHWFELENMVQNDSASHYVLSEIKKRFASLKENFLQAAASSPVHGFVCSLRRILEDLPELQESEYEKMIRVCEEIVDHMLMVLSSKSKSEAAPSFEEMGESIDHLARTCSKLTNAEEISINAAHQLILSCAWLNLKECSHLAAQIGIRLLVSENVSLIRRCATTIDQILIRCRHKGAIEAAADALAALCRAIFSSNSARAKEIPRQLLEEFLEKLESGQLCGSVTRRSAGLSLFVAKVVSSEPSKSNRVLVQIATARLLRLSQEPLPVEPGADLTSDVPQSLALHILKSLVHDASLSGDLYWSLPSILRLSVDNFAHPQWSLRNAALQLYGAAVPRLVGPAKNRESLEGSLSAAEFFHKFPELKDYLADQLSSPERNLLSPGLIPTLGILCRLLPSPSAEDFEIFLACLGPLLGHSVAQVRSLAAKSVLAFLPLKSSKRRAVELVADCLRIVNQVPGTDSSDFTFLGVALNRWVSPTDLLHGLLLCLQEVLTRCRHVALSCDDWEQLRQHCSRLNVVEEKHPCYYVRHAALQIFHSEGLRVDWQTTAELFVDPVAMETLRQKPGFSAWIRLRCERVLTQCPLNCLLPAIDLCLPPPRGLDLVETGMRTLTNRLIKLSSSSIIYNQLLSFVSYYIVHPELFPELLPLCLECVIKRGVGGLLIDDVPLSWFVNFFIDDCVENRKFGTSTAVAAIPALSVIVRDSTEKDLLPDIGLIIRKLIKILYDAALPSQAVSFRLCAAQSLQLCGRYLLASRDNVDGDLILLVVNLLQDEDRQVRAEASRFVTSLGLHERFCSLDVSLLSPVVSMELFCRNLREWYDDAFLVQFLTRQLKREDSGDRTEQEEVVEYLFEHEDPNFFAEELPLVNLMGDVLKLVIGALKERDPALARRLIEADSEDILQETEDFLKSSAITPAGSGFLRFLNSEKDFLSVCKLRLRLEVCSLLFEDGDSTRFQLALQNICQYANS